MKLTWIAVLASLLSIAPAANATVTLLDSNDWKFTMTGFTELDAIQDSTRSFTEVIGNTPVARTGTASGDNGQMVFSLRNSRFGFGVQAPEQDGWKSRGYFEFDFLGFEPSVGQATVSATGSTASTQSQSSFEQNASLRVRHLYMNVENDSGWKFLAGQTWGLFGWQPAYFTAVFSVAPTPGELYQRALQVTSMKTMNFGANTLQVAASLERPSDKDSSMPNLVVGARYVFENYRAGYATTYGDVKTEALSVGVSAVFKQFATATANTTTGNGLGYVNSQAIAWDAQVPLIASSDAKDHSNTLMLSGEFTAGTGYADSLPSWTGGLTAYPTSSSFAATNMDAGFGAFDSNNNFQLVTLETWNANLQYQFVEWMHSFATLGYAQTSAVNLGNFATASASSGGYDKTFMTYVNFAHDFTKQIRMGLEYGNIGTHYTAGNFIAQDNRIQLTGLFRF